MNSEEFSVKKVLPVLLAVMMSMLLVMLDSTVINLAVPKLEKVFQTDLKTIQWTITGYTLALSAIIPLAGWFSDRFKAKWVLAFSVILFTISSFLCAISANPAELILFRVLQGIGGGMIAPISMAVSFTAVPADKRGSVMGLLGLPMLVAPLLGPLLAGWLLEYASWNWIFLINLPLGLIALFLVLNYVPVTERKKQFKLDVFGAILAPLSFTTLVYAVHNSSVYGWQNAHTLDSVNDWRSSVHCLCDC